MKQALTFSVTVILVAGFVSAALQTIAPCGWTGVAQAQTYCVPPLAPLPRDNWPKDTKVYVKIQADVFDSVEIEAIKAAFKAWHARRISNCSNVSYPEPYELVSAPPAHSGNVFYVRYDGVYTAPSRPLLTMRVITHITRRQPCLET